MNSILNQNLFFRGTKESCKLPGPGSKSEELVNAEPIILAEYAGVMHQNGQINCPCITTGL